MPCFSAADNSSTTCVPSGERIVFVGDSTIRHTYLSLVYALRYGQERCDFLGDKKIEHKYHSWTEFFNRTNEELAPHELCDCWRSMVPGTFMYKSTENRYFSLQQHNLSVTYLSWYGYIHMHGNWWPGTPLPSNCTLPFRSEDCAPDFAWNLPFLDAHAKILASLRPTTLVVSGAAHHSPVDMRGHVDWRNTETWKKFAEVVHAAAPSARVVWATPTDNVQPGIQHSDRAFAEQYFHDIFDAHALSQHFDRSTRTDWYTDGTHLRCKPNYALLRRLLRQLFSQDSPDEQPAVAELVRASAALAAHDDEVIDRLFVRSGCEHAYLDMGSNVGVQLRKLYEPARYPRSPIIRTFQAAFGPPPWCNVCAIGFEPNPRHQPRLREMQHRLSVAGAPVHVFHAAVSDSLTTLPFRAEGDEKPWVRDLHLGSALLTGVGVYTANGPRDSPATNGSTSGPVVMVRTIDIARVVHRVNSLLSRRHSGRRGGSRVLMKLDVEGDEPRILLHLVRTQAACLIDQIMVEWHPIHHHNHELQRFMSMSPAQRAQRAVETPSAAGVTALVNVTRALQGAVENALTDGASNRDCRTRLDLLDDETFKSDGIPLPELPICPPRSNI